MLTPASLSTEGKTQRRHSLREPDERPSFLGKIPLQGRTLNWATRHKSLRFWPISRTRFLVFYVASESAVSIERILDGRRDVVALLEQGAEESFEGE